MQLIRLQVLSNFIGPEGSFKKDDELKTADEKRARYLIEKGLCRLQRLPGPPNNKMKIPPENKADDDEDSAKNSSGAPTTGPSTDSPSSSAPGKATQPLFSEADPASAASKSNGVTSRRGRRSRRGARGIDPLQ